MRAFGSFLGTRRLYSKSAHIMRVAKYVVPFPFFVIPSAGWGLAEAALLIYLYLGLHMRGAAEPFYVMCQISSQRGQLRAAATLLLSGHGIQGVEGRGPIRGHCS